MFKKYPHVERLDSEKVEGLLQGTVHIQPKLDGANASIWMENGVIRAGSRKRQLTFIDGDELMGFSEWVIDHDHMLHRFFDHHPDLRLFGEWLVPHSLKTYRADAWRRFYVFDIAFPLENEDDEWRFLQYEDYVDLLDSIGLDYVPVIAKMTNATVESLTEMLKKNTFLLEDGEGFGEGIVIKRYDFINYEGKCVWGKIVRNEFKEKHLRVMGIGEVELKASPEVEFALEYVTRGRVEKEIAKLKNDESFNGERSRMIPALLGIIYHDVVTEELWEFLKKKKYRVVIDFKKLQMTVTHQVKSVYPEFF